MNVYMETDELQSGQARYRGGQGLTSLAERTSKVKDNVPAASSSASSTPIDHKMNSPQNMNFTNTELSQ